jgi:TolB protein
VRRLTSSQFGAFAPDYSPDGRRISFWRLFPPPTQGVLFTMRADGSALVRLTSACAPGECAGDTNPAWAPDGRRIVFVRDLTPPTLFPGTSPGLQLMTANMDGSGEQTMRGFPWVYRAGGKPQGMEPFDPQWSPDGTRLAVTIVETGEGAAIFTLDPDGTNLRRITPRRLNAGNPDWSPDAKRIVFNSSYVGRGKVEIYTVRPDGSGLRRVRREPNRSYSLQPVWSPDGGRIAFVHGSIGDASKDITWLQDGGFLPVGHGAGQETPQIWTMSPNGTGLRKVTRGPRPAFRPDWGPRAR